LTITAAAAAISIAGSASAANIHFTCTGDTTCTSGATQIAANSQGGPISFGLEHTGSSFTGMLRLDILVPTNLGTATENLSINGTPLSLVGTWSQANQKLDAFLGISSQGANPLNNYIGNDPADPNGSPSGFFVYQATFSNVTLPKQQGSATPVPFAFDVGSGIDNPVAGDFVLGFIKTGVNSWEGTPNSETILINSNCTDVAKCDLPPTPAPEPWSGALLGLGMLGLGAAAARRRH
jgi:MYXO-CTERM domain-containing protein